MAWSRRFVLLPTAACGLWLILSAGSSEEKQLIIYAPQVTFAVQVSDREGREYADLFSVLGPISRINMKIEGARARFTGGVQEGLLTNGENTARVGQNRVRFPGKTIFAEGRVHIPLVALPALLQEMAGLKAELHEQGRRLFVENTQTRFSIELKKGETAEMLLGFSLRVNPTIHQEGNNLRMVFRQEPVVMTSNSVSFDDPQISTLRFEEKNGTAEITVTGSAPLAVSFADHGKTLSIKLAPAAVVSTPATPPATQPQPSSPQAVVAAPAAAPPASGSPVPFDSVRYFVMIDPGHGGTDPGVKFSDKVIEKDITLTLAKRLRTELQNRGIPAVLARESDTTVSNDQRAIAANGQRTALFVSLHAGGMGSGVRVYATVMPKREPVQGRFIPWHRAQEAYRDRSLLLARAVASEVSARKVPARMFAAPIPPLNAIGAPAIAIEVAPPSAGAAVEEFEKGGYQQAIAVATATAIVNTRNKLEEMR